MIKTDECLDIYALSTKKKEKRKRISYVIFETVLHVEAQ